MKSYIRTTELKHLQNWSTQAANSRALMMVVIGRRRVGKTALLNHAFSPDSSHSSIYLFVSRKQERLLCEEFVGQVHAQLSIPIFGTPSSLREVMEILLQYSCTNPLTLILDEFQAIQRDYPTWSGQWLEQMHRERVAASGLYNIVGSYWERGNQNEIDIVAINEVEKTALIAEVKRNSANIRLSGLQEKAEKNT